PPAGFFPTLGRLVPRNRDARLAVLGSPVPRSRPAGYSSRSATALRRRIVAGVLVFVSIVLITIYFREPSGGNLHGIQSGAAAIISRPPSEFQQQVGIAAGSNSGIRVNDPVVNSDGLVGLVTQVAHDTAEVTLLTDPNLKVSALDQKTRATGVAGHGQGRGT